MCEQLCRLCAKDIQPSEVPIRLFDNQNKKLLQQILDLTGITLRKSLGLPKLMCCDCKEDLFYAYQFRENFLKVQKNFKINNTKASKKLSSNEVIEETEFMQVYVVKEEKLNDCGADEEKEINIGDYIRKNRTLNKESRDDINVLDLNPREENAFEDVKISIEVICDEENLDISTTLSDDGLDNTANHNTEDLEENNKKTKITKSRRKRKNCENDAAIYICDQCGNHFTCKDYFRSHLRRHSGDKRYACELCPDKFLTRGELKRHVRRHTGERPFACKYCDQKFADNSTRIQHERRHRNERPYVCTHCGKAFVISSTLKAHILTHTGERHFKCDVCNKAFARKTHLVVHLRSIMHKQAAEKEKLSCL